jgi:hypothetical protein
MHKDPRSERGDLTGPRWAQAGLPSPLRWPVRSRFPCTRRIFNPKSLGAANRQRGEPFALEAIHKLEREEEDLRREINHLEGSTLSWRRRKTPAEGKP